MKRNAGIVELRLEIVYVAWDHVHQAQHCIALDGFVTGPDRRAESMFGAVDTNDDRQGRGCVEHIVFRFVSKARVIGGYRQRRVPALAESRA
ncbi:hypothetical protein BH09ACT7_BH09ACT7_38950 [soil metagenome]